MGRRSGPKTPARRVSECFVGVVLGDGAVGGPEGALSS